MIFLFIFPDFIFLHTQKAKMINTVRRIENERDKKQSKKIIDMKKQQANSATHQRKRQVGELFYGETKQQ